MTIVDGEKVVVGGSNFNNLVGVVRFVGHTHFSGGVWVGIELPAKAGRNDGTVDDVRYFACKKDHGLFVRQDQIKQKQRGAELNWTYHSVHLQYCEDESSNVRVTAAEYDDHINQFELLTDSPIKAIHHTTPPPLHPSSYITTQHPPPRHNSTPDTNSTGVKIETVLPTSIQTASSTTYRSRSPDHHHGAVGGGMTEKTIYRYHYTNSPNADTVHMQQPQTTTTGSTNAAYLRPTISSERKCTNTNNPSSGITTIRNIEPITKNNPVSEFVNRNKKLTTTPPKPTPTTTTTTSSTTSTHSSPTGSSGKTTPRDRSAIPTTTQARPPSPPALTTITTPAIPPTAPTTTSGSSGMVYTNPLISVPNTNYRRSPPPPTPAQIFASTSFSGNSTPLTHSTSSPVALASQTILHQASPIQRSNTTTLLHHGSNGVVLLQKETSPVSSPSGSNNDLTSSFTPIHQTASTSSVSSMHHSLSQSTSMHSFDRIVGTVKDEEAASLTQHPSPLYNPDLTFKAFSERGDLKVKPFADSLWRAPDPDRHGTPREQLITARSTNTNGTDEISSSLDIVIEQRCPSPIDPILAPQVHSRGHSISTNTSTTSSGTRSNVSTTSQATDDTTLLTGFRSTESNLSSATIIFNRNTSGIPPNLSMEQPLPVHSTEDRNQAGKTPSPINPDLQKYFELYEMEVKAHNQSRTLLEESRAEALSLKHQILAAQTAHHELKTELQHIKAQLEQTTEKLAVLQAQEEQQKNNTEHKTTQVTPSLMPLELSESVESIDVAEPLSPLTNYDPNCTGEQSPPTLASVELEILPPTRSQSEDFVADRSSPVSLRGVGVNVLQANLTHAEEQIKELREQIHEQKRHLEEHANKEKELSQSLRKKDLELTDYVNDREKEIAALQLRLAVEVEKRLNDSINDEQQRALTRPMVSSVPKRRSSGDVTSTITEESNKKSLSLLSEDLKAEKASHEQTKKKLLDTAEEVVQLKTAAIVTMDAHNKEKTDLVTSHSQEAAELNKKIVALQQAISEAQPPSKPQKTPPRKGSDLTRLTPPSTKLPQDANNKESASSSMISSRSNSHDFVPDDASQFNLVEQLKRYNMKSASFLTEVDEDEISNTSQSGALQEVPSSSAAAGSCRSSKVSIAADPVKRTPVETSDELRAQVAKLQTQLKSVTALKCQLEDEIENRKTTDTFRLKSTFPKLFTMLEAEWDRVKYIAELHNNSFVSFTPQPTPPTSGAPPNTPAHALLPVKMGSNHFEKLQHPSQGWSEGRQGTPGSPLGSLQGMAPQSVTSIGSFTASESTASIRGLNPVTGLNLPSQISFNTYAQLHSLGDVSDPPTTSHSSSSCSLKSHHGQKKSLKAIISSVVAATALVKKHHQQHPTSKFQHKQQVTISGVIISLLGNPQVMLLLIIFAVLLLFYYFWQA